MPYYAFPFAEADINRIVVPSNPGSAPPRRPGKKLRVEYLKDSLQQFPHLIRLVDGLQRAGAPLDRFERWCLDADSWHQCLQTCLESQNIPEVVGTWNDWLWPSAAEASAYNTDETPGFPRGDAWEISCRMDVAGLKEFAEMVPGDKGEHARLLAELCEREGTIEGDVTILSTLGHQKKVAGASLGRVFFPWISFPNLSRSARDFGSPPGTKEFDMPNAVVHFALVWAKEYGLDLPCFQRYHANKGTWRKIVMQWFALAEQDAKKALLQACFGFAFPSRASGKPVICPLLEGLAADAMRLRATMCERHPSLLAAMRAAGRPRPETSTMAFLLFDKENQTMQAFRKLLPKYGFALVAPVFDAVLAVPQSRTEEDGTERAPNQDALLDAGQKIWPHQATGDCAEHIARTLVQQHGHPYGPGPAPTWALLMHWHCSPEPVSRRSQWYQRSNLQFEQPDLLPPHHGDLPQCSH